MVGTCLCVRTRGVVYRCKGSAVVLESVWRLVNLPASDPTASLLWTHVSPGWLAQHLVSQPLVQCIDGLLRVIIQLPEDEGMVVASASRLQLADASDLSQRSVAIIRITGAGEHECM